MNLEKLFYTIGTAFFAVFLMCGALVLTNKLNMWMVGFIAFAISTASFAISYFVAKKSHK